MLSITFHFLDRTFSQLMFNALSFLVALGIILVIFDENFYPYSFDSLISLLHIIEVMLSVIAFTNSCVLMWYLKTQPSPILMYPDPPDTAYAMYPRISFVEPQTANAPLPIPMAPPPYSP